MSRITAIATAMTSLLVVTPVRAQYCNDLATKSQRAAKIAMLSDGVGQEIERIEVPPPDVAAYIVSEEQAAIRQNNLSRLRILRGHPFYRAAEVRKHFAVYRQNLDAALAADKIADEAVYLSVALSRSEDLAKAISDYIDFDARRTPRVLDQKQGQAAEFIVPVVKDKILETLQCAVRQMREP